MLLLLMLDSRCLNIQISYAITRENTGLDEIILFAVIVTLIAKDNW